jgi:hypothetical protein
VEIKESEKIMNPEIIKHLKEAETALRAAYELAEGIPPVDAPRPGVTLINLSIPELVVLTEIFFNHAPAYFYSQTDQRLKEACQDLLKRLTAASLTHITLSDLEPNPLLVDKIKELLTQASREEDSEKSSEL